MIYAIIQARMSSTRLPGKVLKGIKGKPSLHYVLGRIAKSKLIDQIAVATTYSDSDKKIAELATKMGYPFFRGSEEDVLDRYYQTAGMLGAEAGDHIVRITADCPLIDFRIIDRVIQYHLDCQNDYTSNTIVPTFPDGMDVEIFTFGALKLAWQNAKLPSEREHVTPYIRGNGFKIGCVKNESDLSQYRLTVDEAEDFLLVSHIIHHFEDLEFSLEDILKVMDENPQWANINRKYQRNTAYEAMLTQEFHDRIKAYLHDKTILITGGTGSFGNQFVRRLLDDFSAKKIIIYSRDEYKQYEMKNRLQKNYDISSLRFFIGDVRDKERFSMACRSVDLIIHAAALKQVPVCEYNPFEAVKTNVFGAQNIIDVAIERNVQKVIALSTDKAVNPINLYGGTKLVSDKLFISSNAYAGNEGTIFSVVRYGNVANSRGSVIPFFRGMIEEGHQILPITDYRMTRFWISLNDGADLVFKALLESKGGETYISKIPSFAVKELAYAIGGDGIGLKEVGIREGEKLHEVMITREDSRHTFEYSHHYIIYPDFEWWDYRKHFTEGGIPVSEGFEYSSEKNTQWMDREVLRGKLKEIQ